MKRLKLLIVTLITILTLSTSVKAVPEATEIPFENAVKTEIQSKVPMSRKSLALKFLLAMMGVAASSIIIYVGLSVYNRFIYGSAVQKLVKNEDDDYKTPHNIKEALDIFLKKTKW